MTRQIVMSQSERGVVELRKELQRELGAISELSFEVRGPKVNIRGVDPTVLVAIVGASGTALGTLIGGVLSVMGQKQKKIVITGRTGRQIEISGPVSPEELDQYAEKAREIDVELIEW